VNVFLTGASSGIGAALAREFAQRGATLGLVARRTSLLETLAQEFPGRCSIYPLDVTDRAALLAAARDFDARSGGADVVIANAGVSVGTLTEFAEDLDAFDMVLRTNLSAAASTFHPFIGPMRARGRGRLVGIASVAGVRGIPGAGAYSASKAALIAYCESLRIELRGTGVKVVTIAPGFIRTPMTARNPYPMPFLMDVGAFARRAADAIERGDSYVVIPWRMGVLARILRLVPNWLFDRAMARRPRKPRMAKAPD
jgi:short-subunit dehydrogenase